MVIAADMYFEVAEWNEIVAYLCELWLIIKDQNGIHCPKLIERLQPVFEKRKIMEERYSFWSRNKVSEAETSITETETGISDTESTQSKVKYIYNNNKGGMGENENDTSSKKSAEQGSDTTSHTPPPPSHADSPEKPTRKKSKWPVTQEERTQKIQGTIAYYETLGYGRDDILHVANKCWISDGEKWIKNPASKLSNRLDNAIKRQQIKIIPKKTESNGSSDLEEKCKEYHKATEMGTSSELKLKRWNEIFFQVKKHYLVHYFPKIQWVTTENPQ